MESNNEFLPQLTTSDNPFDPYDDFKSWFLFDISHSYNSCQLLDRFLYSSSDLSFEDRKILTSNAIDEIVKLLGEPYMKLTRPGQVHSQASNS